MPQQQKKNAEEKVGIVRQMRNQRQQYRLYRYFSKQIIIYFSC